MDHQNNQNPPTSMPPTNMQSTQSLDTSTPDNPYKFILDTQHQPKKGLQMNGGSGLKNKIFAILGIGIVLIIVVVVANALFFKKENNATKLSALAAQQTEIIRVSDLGLKTAVDGDTRNFAETTKLTVQTQLNLLTAYLKKNNVTVTPLILQSKLDKKTDTALTTAASANRFDDVFKETLKAELVSYATNIKDAYTTASNPTSKKLMSDSFDSIETLLK